MRALALDIGLLVLRLGLGALMIFSHGWPKLANFSARMATFSDPLGVGSGVSLGLAVFAEFFCALGILMGLATRLAAIPLLTTMLVAALIQHAPDPWPKPELALVYAVSFAALILAGPGRFSADAVLLRRRATPTSR